MTQTVVITGASSGIGRACVTRFASEGWRVIALSRSKPASEACDGEANPGAVIWLPIDLAAPDAARRFFESHRERVGPITALVNCAGVAVRAKAEDVSDAAWEEMFRVNVTAAFAMVREAVASLPADGRGAIVNVSSIAGRLRSASLSVAYSTSKAALIGMTRHLAGELGPRGIRVNCVCPSQTMTPMLEAALSKDDQARLAASIPLRRLAQPDEQATVIHFLCTRQASYINGAVIDVNGGAL